MTKESLEYDPVIHGYSVAIGNNYDIYIVKDVVKILRWIRHTDTTEQYAREFSKKLISFEIFLRMKWESEGIKIKGKITAKKLIKLGLIPDRYYR